MMLHLLRVEGLYPSAQRSIAAYLSARANTPRAERGGEFLLLLENTLTDALLGTAYEDRSEALRFLEHFDHFTSARKRFMFHTLLAELGVIEADVEFDLSRVTYTEYATWVNLEMCALKVLRAHQYGRPDLATDADREYVMDQLASGSVRNVFEADVFAHLVALFAARRIDPGSPWVAKGVDHLLRCQNPDGGLPFIAGWEPFTTAVAGLALAEAGEDVSLLAHMGRFVALHQGPDGGWPFAPGVTQSDADCSPYALEFLRAAGSEAFASEIRRGEDYLLGLVNHDGGFGTYRRGDSSEVGVTGSAVSALAPARERCGPELDAAVVFLLSRQKPDGTFERGWSLSEANSVFRALFALRHHTKEPETGEQASTEKAVGLSARALLDTQNTDGGWGQRAGDPSDVLSTSYSLLALTAADETAPAQARGIRYLLGRQEGDGGFTSVPDSAGPRPIPHDIPVLADAFALLALGHALGAPHDPA